MLRYGVSRAAGSFSLCNVYFKRSNSSRPFDSTALRSKRNSNLFTRVSVISSRMLLVGFTFPSDSQRELCTMLNKWTGNEWEIFLCVSKSSKLTKRGSFSNGTIRSAALYTNQRPLSLNDTREIFEQRCSNNSFVTILNHSRRN